MKMNIFPALIVAFKKFALYISAFVWCTFMTDQCNFYLAVLFQIAFSC